MDFLLEKLMTQQKLETALNFAKKGIKVIPLHSNTKIPILKDWTNRGTLNDLQILDWHQKHDDCNFGLLTGDNLVVLDVDNKNNKEGSKVLEALGDFSNTFTVSTASGGLHYYFKTKENLKSRNFGNGLEIKSLGSQVLAPCSIINNVEYKILNDTEFAEFPMCLYEAFKSSKNTDSKDYSNNILKQFDWSEQQKNALSNTLDSIDPNLDHDSWLEVIFATFNLYGKHEETIDLLINWSSSSTKFSAKVFWKKVNSYNPNHTEKLGYPTLSEMQWKYPKKGKSLKKNEFGNLIQKSLTEKVIELLNDHGNTPSKQHISALESITSAMSHGIDSADKFRIAFPLETGMGKTTCVIALACLLEPLNKSLLVCSEQIEQLIEMRDSMIKAGVNEANIGIYHKVNNVNLASIKLEEMHNYQFLLVSHSRVHNDSKSSTSERLLKYENGKRSLTIWDESLITTEAYYCSLYEMVNAINDWISRYSGKKKEGRCSKNNSDDYEKLNNYFLQVKELFDSEINETILEIPYVSDEILNRNLINTIVTNYLYKSVLDTLIKFNQFGKVRITKGKDGTSIVQFDQLVDDCFDKIIVMDASSRIRKLMNFDKSLTVHPLGVNKTYKNIEILHADVKSSKSSFEVNGSHLKDYLNEFQHLLKNEIPSDKNIIIFCHKDIKQEIMTWAQDLYPLRQIHVLSWGQHKATNKYSHVEYVFTCGILYRDWKEISSSIIAQTGSLNYLLLDHDVQETYYSEQAELLYQGFSRGNSRNTKDGIAGKQTIYMFHPKEDYSKVMTYLRRVMHGVQESRYQPKYLIQGRKNAIDYLELASAIRDYLTSMGDDVMQLSKAIIRKTLAPELNSNSKTWRKAILKVESELKGWIFGTKLVVRNT